VFLLLHLHLGDFPRCGAGTPWLLRQGLAEGPSVLLLLSQLLRVRACNKRLDRQRRCTAT
jgi:hypothetical protein